MKPWLAALTAVGLASAPLRAHAQPIIGYDVAAGCMARAVTAGINLPEGQEELYVAKCVQDEREALTFLLNNWPKMAPEMRADCLSRVSENRMALQRNGSYYATLALLCPAFHQRGHH